MPDLLLVFSRWWKMILGLSLIATVIALVISLIVPKEYLSTATALPANSQMADKGRIFNKSIESLYSEFGSTDDLDRVEGTGKLDTIYLAAAQQFNLASHYNISSADHPLYKAAMHLKKHTDILKSGYGELKIKVWDTDPEMAASLCNFLLQAIQSIHQKLQAENNNLVLEKLRADYNSMQGQLKGSLDTSSSKAGHLPATTSPNRQQAADELNEYSRLISEYDIALRTNAPVLLTVEHAHPSPWADKPDVVLNVLATLLAALIFSFLLSLFMESRKAVD